MKPGVIAQRERLEEIMSSIGASTLTDLARRAEVSPTTLTRWWREEKDDHLLSQRTMKKIEQLSDGRASNASGGLNSPALREAVALVLRLALEVQDEEIANNVTRLIVALYNERVRRGEPFESDSAARVALDLLRG